MGIKTPAETTQQAHPQPQTALHKPTPATNLANHPNLKAIPPKAAHLPTTQPPSRLKQTNALAKRQPQAARPNSRRLPTTPTFKPLSTAQPTTNLGTTPTSRPPCQAAHLPPTPTSRPPGQSRPVCQPPQPLSRPKQTQPATQPGQNHPNTKAAPPKPPTRQPAPHLPGPRRPRPPPARQQAATAASAPSE